MPAQPVARAPDPPAVPVVDDENPWLGLAPFTEATRRYFFGRHEEIRDLFLRVHRSRLTVLFGHSGLGKTSLLGAGLLPRLRSEGYRPGLVRLRFDDGLASLGDQMRQAFREALADPPTAGAIPGEPWSGCRTLWEILHHRERSPADLDRAPPVLIFDQFEELFTLGEDRRPEEVQAFMAELADVVENRPPAMLRDQFRLDPQASVRYDFGPSPLRIVLTLREDYLAHLEAWRQSMPSLMRNRMPLHLLRGPQALEAVVEPGRVGGREIISETVGAQIVRFVARQNPDVPLEEIDAVPPLVSLVCRELNTLRLQAGQPAVSEELLKGRSEDILAEFYERCFAGQSVELRRFVEDRLLTAAGFRSSVPRDTAEAELAERGIPASALDDLIRGRLLSSDERRGLQWLELTHDVLAPLVARSRGRRREREARERAEQEAARKEGESREREEDARREGMLQQARAEAKRRGRFLVAVLVLMMLAVTLGVLAERQRRTAVVERQMADLARQRSQVIATELEAKNVLLATASIEATNLLKQLQQAFQAETNANQKLYATNRVLAQLTEDLQAATNDLTQARQNAEEKTREATEQRAIADEKKSEAEQTEARRRAAEFNAYLGSAALLTQLENYRLAALSLANTSNQLLESAVSPERLTARNLLSWALNLSAPQGSASSTSGRVARTAVPLRDLAASPRATSLITVGEEVPGVGGFVGVFNEGLSDTPRLVRGHNAPVSSVGIGPDGSWFLTAGLDQQLLRWTLPEARLFSSSRLSAPIEAMAVSHDGRWVATCGIELGIDLRSTDRDASPLSLPNAPRGVTGVAFGPHVEFVAATATAGTEGHLHVWRITHTGRGRVRFQDPDVRTNSVPLLCLAADASGAQLAAGAEDATIRIWNADDGGPQHVLRGHRSRVLRVAFHPTQTNWLVSASLDRTLRLWDLPSERTLRVFEGHEAAVVGLAFTPDRLFSCGSDKTVREWDAGLSDPGYLSILLTNSEPRACAISQDGTRIAVGFANGALRCLSLPDLRTEWLADGAHGGGIMRVAFFRQGRSLASVGLDGMLKRWEVATGSLVGTNAGPPNGLMSLAISSVTSDGPLIAAGGQGGESTVDGANRLGTSALNGVIVLLDTASGEMTSWPAHTNEVLSLSFDSRDGSLISTGEDGLTRRWNPTHPTADEPLMRTEPGMGAGAVINPKGNVIVRVGRSGSVDVFDRSTGKTREFIGHENTVLDAVFTTGGEQVLTVSTDATIRAWDLSAQLSDPLLFTLRLPTPGTRAVPVWDFDFLPRSTTDGNAWLAAALTSGELVVYPLGRIEPGEAAGSNRGNQNFRGTGHALR